MSSNQGPAAPASGGWVERLARYRVPVSWGLIAIGLGLGAIPITTFVLYKQDSLAVEVWGAFLSLFVTIVGLVYIVLAPAASHRQEADRLRIVLLTVAGGAGLVTAVLGVVLPFSTTQYRDVLSGGMKMWRENGWVLFRVGAALLGGLLLVFVGLQLGRTFERTHTRLRQLQYGYNAVFSSILLFLVLLLINVLSYAPLWPFTAFAHTGDWTSSRLYSLSDSTKNLLRDLKQPVKVYVLLPSSSQVTREVQTLLDNCRAVNPQMFNWELLSPDYNRDEVIDLIRKYKLADSRGLLVVYGTGDDAPHELIKPTDLASDQGMDPTSGRFAFKGESALWKALNALTSGKTRGNIYFTQGHGELDYSENMRRERNADSMGQLRSELERRNYQTHALPLKGEGPSIPADADMVVVAGPTQKWGEGALKALREFLAGTGRSKPGTAIICQGVVAGDDGKMIATGLEGIVAEHGVRIRDDRLLVVQPVLAMQGRSPLIVAVLTNPDSDNPVARAFFQPGRNPAAFLLENARTVQPAQNNPNAPSRYSAESLLVTFPDQLIVSDTNLSAEPRAVVTDLRGNLAELRRRVSPEPVPVAVAVSEGKNAMPRIPGHEGLVQEGKPRLVVVGDRAWMSNRVIQAQGGVRQTDLFASCVSWLRGQSDLGSAPIDDKQRQPYQPDIPPGGGLRLLVLPGFLLILVLLTLGMGVWVVRRR